MKKKKISILIVVIAILAFLLSYIISYANTSETVYVNLTKLDTKGIGYGIGDPANGTNAGGHVTSAYIWNLTTYDTSTSTSASKNQRNLYCIKANYGNSWNTNKDTIVATVMSNLGLNKYARDNGLELLQTQVGDRYVLEEMLKDGFNLGGEQSGHVILLDYNPTGDGILTSLMLIKSILEEGKKASELGETVKLYPQVLINSKVNANKKYDYDKDKDIKNAIEKLEKEFAGNGRVLIRPSGTDKYVIKL